MELFAAATGCNDPQVASFFLERAGNNVEIAVNHFLDASKDGVEIARYCIDTNTGTTTSSVAAPGPNRAAKRTSESERLPHGSIHFQHQQLTGVGFKRRKTVDAEKGGSGGAQIDLAGEAWQDVGGDIPQPSTKWTDIADRCHR